MKQSIDVLASTNPALCALVTYAFTRGFVAASNRDMDLALSFLPVPIAMSSSLAASFVGTNVATGLFDWMARTPTLQLELPGRIRETLAISRCGLVFALQHKIMTLAHGKLTTDSTQLKRPPKDAKGAVIAARPLAVAERLGKWCGAIDSTASVFVTMGISP